MRWYTPSWRRCVAERRAAAFVDRDGTIIREKEYLSAPGQIEVLPGAVAGLLELQRQGYEIVILTNQSGIARGLFDENQYHTVERELERRLSDRGVRILGTYHCPHHPDFSGACDCRKPAPGLAVRAARELHLDPARSVFIGDRLRDVIMAEELGAQAVLVRTGYGAEEAKRAPASVLVVDDLEEAARRLPPPPGGR